MPQKTKLPLIIAHRGASELAPENTFFAFQKAIEDGAEGLEFDVQLSKDGVPVVFHDTMLKRLANINRKLTHFRADELQKLDVGTWFNKNFPARADAEFSGARIPTLESLFDFLSGYEGRLYVELKCSERNFAPLVDETVKVIRRTKLHKQIVMKSFVLDAISRVRKQYKELTAAALFAPKIVSLIRGRSRLIERAKEFGADELSLHYSLATEKLVRRANEEGMHTTIWTANHPKWIQTATKAGIHAIITNNPARLLAERNDLSTRVS